MNAYAQLSLVALAILAMFYLWRTPYGQAILVELKRGPATGDTAKPY